MAVWFGSAALTACLLAADVGPDPDDNTPPEVSILEPENEAVYYNAPATITIRAEASDDHDFASGLSDLRLKIDDVFIGDPDVEAPFEWSDIVVEAGMHDVAVVARDNYGNESTATHQIAVFEGDPPAGTDDSGTSAAAGDDGSSSGDSKGCSVTTRGTGLPLGLALLLLLPAGLSFRRRR